MNLKESIATGRKNIVKNYKLKEKSHPAMAHERAWRTILESTDSYQLEGVYDLLMHQANYVLMEIGRRKQETLKHLYKRDKE